jgi:hypothetical protein
MGRRKRRPPQVAQQSEDKPAQQSVYPPQPLTPTPPIPPPGEAKAKLEVNKLKREMKKLALEVITLKRAASGRPLLLPARVTDLLAPICALLAAIFTGYLATNAASKTGFFNAAERLNKAELKELANTRYDLQREVSKLGQDKIDLQERIAVAERTILPLKDQIDAVKNLTDLIDEGIDVRVYQSLGLGPAEVFISCRIPEENQDKRTDELLVRAFEAIGKLPNVIAIEGFYLHLTDGMIAKMPRMVRELRMDTCRINCDFGKLPQDSQILGIDFEKCRGKIAVSRPVGFTTLRLYSNTIDFSAFFGHSELFPAIHNLDLAGDGITSETLAGFRSLLGVDFLKLSNTKLTPNVIQELKQFPNLKLAEIPAEIAKPGTIEGTEIQIVNSLGYDMRTPSLNRMVQRMSRKP